MLGRVFMGRYETVRLLGEGGMGKVYLAKQIDLGRQVVVKVMHEHVAADAKFRERFKREIDSMARFQHPYAVTLYDASLNDPQGPCIVMEYIRGVTLDQLLQRNNRLSPVRVGRLLGQICEVLQAAHGEQIIHRDLKPANLMVVDPDTPYEKIKVMDFGLAKLLDAPSLQQVSATGMDFAVGTPGYICPEQVRGDPVDHRGDLYSVGVIIFEMLTGRQPFSGASTMDILIAHATEPPPSFEAIGARAWVPPSIESVVMACLAKDPAQRPQSARDLAERYETALAHEEAVIESEVPQGHPKASATPGADSPVATGPKAAPPKPATDPSAIVHQLEAWMPETIAVYKLRGFIHDAGGEVVESVPGKIRVRLGGRGTRYEIQEQNTLSWFGFGRKAGIDLELQLVQADQGINNKLHITVLMRPASGKPTQSPAFRALCTQIYCDLRAYLMGATNAPNEASK